MVLLYQWFYHRSIKNKGCIQGVIMRWISLIVITLIVFILIALSGCISPQVNPTLVEIGPEEETVFNPLENAIGALLSDDGLRMAREPDYTIHTIIGENVTKEGDAKTWILAVKAEKSFYFVYSGNGFFTMDWHEENPGHAINLNNILSPSELLSQNSQRIDTLFSGDISRIRELELNNGRYYIRGFREGNELQYTFDAVTGKEI